MSIYASEVKLDQPVKMLSYVFPAWLTFFPLSFN